MLGKTIIYQVVIVAFVTIHKMHTKLGIMECFYNQAATMLAIVTMHHHSFILRIRTEQNTHSLNDIFPAYIVYLLV